MVISDQQQASGQKWNLNGILKEELDIFYFSSTVYIHYYSVLVLGVQHSDQATMYLAALFPQHFKYLKIWILMESMEWELVKNQGKWRDSWRAEKKKQ